MGRRKVEIDWDVVDDMLRTYCSGRDIADRLGIDETTLYKRCRLDKKEDFSARQQKMRSGTRYILRAAQLREARGYEYEETEIEKDARGAVKKVTTKHIRREPSTAMLIWLGKNLLGQTDKVDTTLSISAFQVLGDLPEGTPDLDD